jgi:hypothetical protein
VPGGVGFDHLAAVLLNEALLAKAAVAKVLREAA